MELFIYSVAISVVLLIFFIPFFRYLKFGQTIRLEGPKTHQRKSGTPTFGGTIIVITTVIVFLIYALINKYDYRIIILLLMPLVLFGLIGFIDDYLIVIKKNNLGLKPLIKLCLQILGAIIYYFIFLDFGLPTTVSILGLIIDLKFLYGILILLMFLASSNAVNLTDGLDGLATGLVIIALSGTWFLANHNQSVEIAIFIIILIGALVGFICFNIIPAKIFMGDTGSLALGAMIANLFILLKMELLLIIIGIVFVMETLSVIMQVTYFKKTKGKRIFLMTPIHHHFELKGWSELKVDIVFWTIGIIAAIIAVFLGIRFY